MCAPISTTVANVISSSAAFALLVNHVIALTTVLGVVGFKFFKVLRALIRS